MNETLFVQLVNLTAGALLLAAVLVLWLRELSVIIRVFALQGAALAGLVAVLAVEAWSTELAGLAVAVLLLRAWVLPAVLRRALAAAGPERRVTRPLVNVAASLLAAAALTLLALAVSRPLVELAPSTATQAVPIGLAVVLIGFFVIVTRRRALSQVIGFLLMDNGITAVGFLLSASIGLVAEAGVALDVLLVVLVLHTLTSRMRDLFGGTDLDDLQELRD